MSEVARAFTERNAIRTATAPRCTCDTRRRSGPPGSPSPAGAIRLEHARKPVIARRDYVMGKLTYTSGVRAAELCEEPSCERTGDQP
jgi:hypothetical protein